MKFFLYSTRFEAYVQVSHKQARRRCKGRILSFPKFERFYFDTTRGGLWTPQMIRDFDPRIEVRKYREKANRQHTC